METLMIDKVENSSCYKTLAALCYSTARDILNTIKTNEQPDGDVYVTAQQMASEVERADLCSSYEEIKIRELVPVVVFMQAHAMIEAVVIGDRMALSKCIVTCLTKGKHEKSGLPSTFLPLSLQSVVLEIACKLILQGFEAAEEAGGAPTTSVFDKEGMAALMESLALIESCAEGLADVTKTKEILLRGLAQALVAENSMKRLSRGGFKSLGGIVNVDAVYTASLSTRPRSTQEAVIQRMLDS